MKTYVDKASNSLIIFVSENEPRTHLTGFVAKYGAPKKNLTPQTIEKIKQAIDLKGGFYNVYEIKRKKHIAYPLVMIRGLIKESELDTFNEILSFIDGVRV